MVRVVLRVPDSHVLKQSVICSKDSVLPRPDLLSVPLHYLREPILQPRIILWEEVKTHVHKTRHCKLTHNGLQLQCDFRLCQVGIDIYDHQEIEPIRLIPDFRSNVLYVRGIS